MSNDPPSLRYGVAGEVRTAQDVTTDSDDLDRT